MQVEQTALPNIHTFRKVSMMNNIPVNLMHRISIAPMMEVTNTHFRFFMRLLTKNATLWTEMYHSRTILNNPDNRAISLRFSPLEHPIVCQLGGNNPEELKAAAKFVELAEFDEVNLNCGCPSERVSAGAFGACLMKEPEVVRNCIQAMSEEVCIPCHVKTRIGVDDQDQYEFTKNFIQKVTEVGDNQIIIHARKAFLKGLNPSQNRSIPPLDYERVINLKKDFPNLRITINGGFKSLDSIEDILKEENGLTGCMVGRLAYEDPWELRDVDRRFYNTPNPGYSRREILKIWAQYCDIVLVEQPIIKWPTLIKPIVSLFKGEKFSAHYKRLVSEVSYRRGFDKFSEFMDFVIEDFEKVNKEALDVRPPVSNTVVEDQQINN